MRIVDLMVCAGLCMMCAAVVRADLSTQSGIDDILDALDARGQGLRSFTADVKLSETDTGTGDESVRNGKVWYQADNSGSARIRVSFDKKQTSGKIIEDKIEYVLAGSDLVQRVYRTKTQTTQRVLKPGEKVNLLKLGEGPFPLPVGQKKQDVHAQFEVRKIEPAKDDPADTVHIQLVPKPDTRFARRFKTIDVWVDLKSHMPRRIETLDRNESTTRGTDLDKVQFNPDLSDGDFRLPDVGGDWNKIEEAFQN
jgi:outer membrane lipoprotein-sorting protein